MRSYSLSFILGPRFLDLEAIRKKNQNYQFMNRKLRKNVKANIEEHKNLTICVVTYLFVR